jgi:DNA-directed RNA polymerase subunit F
MEESYVSLAELKVILEKEKTVRGELNPEQQYSLSHASLFTRVPADKVLAIVKELMEIPMMSPFNALKIVDLMPTHLDDVRAIFAKERFSLSKEDADKVLEIVGKYR